MNVYIAELLGTAILVFLGNGVVANVLLEGTKGQRSGWIVISAGWGIAVFVAVACVGEASGAHINPAVTFGLALAQRFEWALVPGYVAAQLAGGFIGALLVYLFYQPHYAKTAEPELKLGTFGTGPAIRAPVSNFLCEALATFVLVLTVLYAANASLALGDQTAKIGLGALGAIPVGLIVFGIGLSLGGTTGYAINPARDFSPRLAHALLPIPGKGGSDWGYAWIPVAGPMAGGALAAGIYLLTGASAPAVG